MIDGEHGVVARNVDAFAMDIYRAARKVRLYARGGRFHHQQRQQAILLLGLTVREAFNQCDEYEDLLKAILDGLGAPPF